MKPTEKQVQAGIKRTLRMLGFAVYDLSQPRATKQTPGIPDLYVIGKNRHLWVEVKRPGGRLTSAQEAFRKECEDAGVPWACWRSAEEAVAWATGGGALADPE